MGSPEIDGSISEVDDIVEQVAESLQVGVDGSEVTLCRPVTLSPIRDRPESDFARVTKLAVTKEISGMADKLTARLGEIENVSPRRA